MVQLIETPILNLINFSSLICTNAARFVIKSGPKVKCLEFGLRRAQGPNGALTATKYSVLGGFVGTSNIYGAMLTGSMCNGTLAHSYIMSFTDEDGPPKGLILDGTDLIEEGMKLRSELGWNSTNLAEFYAFASYANAYPTNYVCLVDTYNTIESGVKNFLIFAVVLKRIGYEPRGIRLDSGDLAGLSIASKKLFRETGEKFGFDFSNLIVIASNDINENAIIGLNEADHQIDVFGIGTNLVTC